MMKSAVFLLALAAMVCGEGEGDITITIRVQDPKNSNEVSNFLVMSKSLTRDPLYLFEGFVTTQCVRLATDGGVIPGTVGMTTTVDVRYTGYMTTALTAIQFNAPFRPFISAGAIYSNTITARYTSLPSQGFTFSFEVWGRR